MLTPHAGKHLIWIFKNLLHLDGQKLYNDSFDNVIDIGVASWWHYTMKYDDRYLRLEEYYRLVSVEELIPLSAFPLIEFEKKKSHLSMEPLPEFDEKEIYDKIFKFLNTVELDNLFIPPPEILWKVGYQKFNDGGTVKYDFERAHHINSGYKYQSFMAQPLSPREVWLPGKLTKNNNIFWMLIGRQFLKKCPLYPDLGLETLISVLKQNAYLDIGRFDISGFGFQFPREYVLICMRVICELYPAHFLDIMADEYETLIKDGISVEMPNGDVLHPPRGTGLGYYEDLKTIVMISLIYDYQLISVYGDQGLIDANMGYFAMFELQRFGFIFSDMDKYTTISSTNTSEWSIKWGGYKVRPSGVERTKDLINPLLGSLFLPFHWERKNALFSFSQENEDFYISKEKGIINFYKLYFGEELYEGELSNSFKDGVGISLRNQHTVGNKKDYRLKDYRVPYEDTNFEVVYLTPFKTKRSKTWPLSIGRKFQQKRERIYKASKFMDSSVYYYSSPRIVYNFPFRIEDRLLPEWAELLYCFYYGATSGSFTYNMDSRQIDMAVQNYCHSTDPIRTARRGGYKILDEDHALSIPSQELMSVVEGLKLIRRRPLDYASRADLPVHESRVEDPLYYHTDINIVNKTITARNSIVTHDKDSDDSLSLIENNLKGFLSRNMAGGKLTTAVDALLLRDNIINIQETHSEDFDFEELDDNLLFNDIDPFNVEGSDDT